MPPSSSPSSLPSPPPPPDARALAANLRLRIKGEVRFDDGSRALYATDASNYRQVPIGVVVPRDLDDLVTTIEICRRAGAPVLARGGGTSLAGQCCNVAVVIDTSKHLRAIRAIDPERRLARVEPGVVLDDLREAAERHRLTFGPDPATHNHCTLGGMIGNDSCGVHSVTAGRTSDNVEALEVLTYDGLRLQVGPTDDADLARIVAAGGRRGEIYRRLRALAERHADEIRRRFPRIPRLVSGYNLPALLPEHGFHVARALVGSEGTCVTVLEATVRLVPSPPHRALLVLAYPDIFTAADHVPQVLGVRPQGLEAIDDRLVADMKKKGMHPREVAMLPDGAAWLLCELGGETPEEAEAAARRAEAALRGSGGAIGARLVADPREQRRFWIVRESALGATARVPGQRDTWEGWEDSAVPPARLGPYLRDLRALMDRFGYSGSFYGHFGDGCLHTRIDFDFSTAAGVERFRRFLDEAADLVVGYGGSLSGEHGDGQARAEILPRMFGAQLCEAFREFKAIWDPDGKMNPGKVVDARRITDDLRLGPAHQPAAPATHFRYPEDDGKLSRAVLRCVGIGECRRAERGTMCPSFRATGDEEHSTRGRARLLHEMLVGDPLRDGFRDQAVHAALDLCLACKGCKVDCPVGVDMATYKAEFLAHHYQGRLRPRAAYAFGHVDRWARLAALAPTLANLFTQTPGLAAAARALAGIAPARPIPRVSGRTFRRWFADWTLRRPRDGGDRRRPVLLWPDTFTNHFHSKTAVDAAVVLDAMGFEVRIPRASLCCGRPLYDFGMLDRARRLLRKTLRVLQAELETGTPVVVLEPSCLAVFRDELLGLMPDDALARRLAAQSFTLAEVLARSPESVPLPTLARSALLHGHCHQTAVVGLGAERQVLGALGLDLTVLDAGCCGMAGAFGFQKDHYEVSMKIGERALLPAVRAAPQETLVVADGFSCREQIAHGTGRAAVHLASVLRQALQPERRAAPRPEGRPARPAL